MVSIHKHNNRYNFFSKNAMKCKVYTILFYLFLFTMYTVLFSLLAERSRSRRAVYTGGRARTMSRHLSLSADGRLQSDTRLPPEDLSWSLHSRGALLRSLIPSTFPSSTSRFSVQIAIAILKCNKLRLGVYSKLFGND